MNTTEIKSKAEQIEQVYNTAVQDKLYSRQCYALAVQTAWKLGGVEVAVSGMTEDCVSKVTFEFDDLSRAQVQYSGVFVIC